MPPIGQSDLHELLTRSRIASCRPALIAVRWASAALLAAAIIYQFVEISSARADVPGQVTVVEPADYSTIILAQKVRSELEITAEQSAKLDNLGNQLHDGLIRCVDVVPGESVNVDYVSRRGLGEATRVGGQVRALLTPIQLRKFHGLFGSSALRRVQTRATSHRVLIRSKWVHVFTVGIDYTHYGEGPYPVTGTAPASGQDPPAPGSASVPPTPAEEPADRAAVPDDAAQAKSQAVLKDVYPIEAKQPVAQRKALARQLLEQGIDKTSNAVDCYVILHNACDIAATTGDAATACDAIDAINQRYYIDAMTMKIDALKKCLAVSPADDTQRRLAAATMESAQEAVKAGDFEAADSLALEAVRAARAARDMPLASATAARVGEIQKLLASAKALKPALDKLKTEPDDTEANLTAGKLLCFVQGKWDDGLPLLSKGSDVPLKTVATAEVAIPVDVETVRSVADQWWVYGEKNASRPARERAAYWYRLALPNLSGLAQTLAEKRIATLEGPSVPGAPPAPVVSYPHSPVDILRLGKTTGPLVRGQWSWSTYGLTSHGESWIEFPAAIDGDYDMEVRMTRNSGFKEIVFTFPAGAPILLGFAGMSGHDATLYSSPQLRVMDIPVARDGVSMTLKFHVTYGKGTSNITITLDGKPYMNFTGLTNGLHANDAYKAIDPSHLAIRVHPNSVFTLHSIRITMLSGSLKTDKP